MESIIHNHVGFFSFLSQHVLSQKISLKTCIKFLNVFFLVHLQNLVEEEEIEQMFHKTDKDMFLRDEPVPLEFYEVIYSL